MSKGGGGDRPNSGYGGDERHLCVKFSQLKKKLRVRSNQALISALDALRRCNLIRHCKEDLGLSEEGYVPEVPRLIVVSQHIALVLDVEGTSGSRFRVSYTINSTITSNLNGIINCLNEDGSDAGINELVEQLLSYADLTYEVILTCINTQDFHAWIVWRDAKGRSTPIPLSSKEYSVERISTDLCRVSIPMNNFIHELWNKVWKRTREYQGKPPPDRQHEEEKTDMGKTEEDHEGGDESLEVRISHVTYMPYLMGEVFMRFINKHNPYHVSIRITQPAAIPLRLGVNAGG